MPSHRLQLGDAEAVILDDPAEAAIHVVTAKYLQNDVFGTYPVRKPACQPYAPESESMRSSNLAAVLRHLEADGLIVRTPDAEDRRKVRVQLTPTGHEVLRENIARRERWLREAIAQSLTEEERALLFKAGELLDRLAAYLGSGPSQRERVTAPAHFMSSQPSGRTEAKRRPGVQAARGLVSDRT